MTPVTILKSSAKVQGGLEKYTSQLIHGFKDRGHPVTLVTTFPPKTALASNVISSRSEYLFSFQKLKKFDQFCEQTLLKHPSPIVLGLDRNRYQTHMRMGNGVHAAFLQRRRDQDPFWKRFSFSINPLHQTLLRIEKEAFENPNLKKIFTNSQMVKEEILSYYPVDQEKIEVIHNGVEWEETKILFSSWKEKKEEALQKYGLSASDYQFLFIGHNYKRKGLDLLLEALSITGRNDFHLTVVGHDKNMPYHLDLVKTLGLEKKVSFLGSVSPVWPLYQMADALVVPSQYDPFANVTIEALAMGLFVLSSPYNGAKEILNANTGLVLPNLSSREAFANALLVTMEHPKTIESSRFIRQSVESLSFKNQIDRLIQGCL